jgi:leucyl aminopeptidase (aminopeptidase T)
MMMVKQAGTGFNRSIGISRRLERAAGVAMGDVLSIRKGERVLIVTNPESEVRTISSALYNAAKALGASPTLLIQPVKTQLDFAEDAAIEALRSEPEVGISVSHSKLGKDRLGMKRNYKHRGKSYDHIFNYLLGSKKMRSFWSPSVTIDMFERTVPLDYRSLKANCLKLKQAFDKASKVRITSRLGTDLTIGLQGRKAFTDDGDFSKPGSGGNLPAGEMFISPELGSGEGRLVFDGCISSDRGVILIKQPIETTVRRNLVTKIKGGREADLLRATLGRARKTTRRFAAESKIPKKDLPSYLTNICNLGELGIGLNNRARIVGNMLEDEKVFRTCHIAIGSNYDADAKALIHLDGLVRNPTIEVFDGRGHPAMIMKSGRIVL